MRILKTSWSHKIDHEVADLKPKVCTKADGSTHVEIPPSDAHSSWAFLNAFALLQNT
jgi:hypothetical protein